MTPRAPGQPNVTFELALPSAPVITIGGSKVAFRFELKKTTTPCAGRNSLVRARTTIASSTVSPASTLRVLALTNSSRLEVWSGVRTIAARKGSAN